jgi:hypothetical protein
MQMPTEGDTPHLAQRPSAARLPARWTAWRLILPALGAIALAGAALIAPGPHGARADSATITITRPPQGPAGANVVAKVAGAMPSHQYNLGFAAQASGCTATAFTAITSAPSFTTGGDGSYTAKFAWPVSSGVGDFYVCAQDAAATTTYLQSSNVYTVLAAAKPSITLARAATPTPSAGATPTGTVAPTATPEPDGVYTVGEQVTITGANFLPGGSQLAIWISGDPSSLGTQLATADGGTTFNSNTQGGFTETVTLPDNRIGQVYLHAATLDGASDAPPTLQADSQVITVHLAPTATPTSIPSPSPTTPSHTGQSNSNSNSNSDVPRVLGIAGLGAFSVLLLIIGTILLVSAGAMQPEDQG